MKCPNCQFYNLAGAKFDIDCGQPLQTETAHTRYGETMAVRLAVHAKYPPQNARYPSQNARIPVLPTVKELIINANISARAKNYKVIKAWWDTDNRAVMEQPGIPVPHQHITDGVYL